MTSHRRFHDVTPQKSEIDALGCMASKSQIASGLKEIAGRYGKVITVTPVPHPKHDEAKDDMYFIHFDRTADAMVASQALKGLLYGFTTLAVSVPRNGSEG